MKKHKATQKHVGQWWLLPNCLCFISITSLSGVSHVRDSNKVMVAIISLKVTACYVTETSTISDMLLAYLTFPTSL